jgi:hypothetical protein
VAAFVAALLVCVGVYNFVTMIAAVQRLGGDASTGYVRDGHYYVGNHGRYTEVSAVDWEQSRVHTRNTLIGHPLAVLGMVYLVIGVVLPAMMGRRSAQAPARLRSVVESGPSVVTARCRGRVRSANVVLRVTVHPGGLIIKPMFAGERAVLPREITAVRPRSWLFARGVEIEHSGIDVASPVGLLVPADGELPRAIRALTPWAG